ncbi:MAG: hypothetical protein ABSC42_05510 [Tepidisphaeraceae bacterium]|jgi:hypothetical protein
MRITSRDVTTLVADLAATPSVNRVIIKKIVSGHLEIETVFPSQFKPTEQIFLDAGHTLHIEADWQLDSAPGDNIIDFVNRVRAEYELAPLNCIIRPGHVEYRSWPGMWAGTWDIGIVD